MVMEMVMLTAVKDRLPMGRSLAASQTSVQGFTLCSVSHIGGHFTGQHAGLDTARHTRGRAAGQGGGGVKFGVMESNP